MTRDMTSDSPFWHIVAFTVPLFIGMMFQQFYHFADTIIVSRILGEGALAAVGSIGAVNFLVLGFSGGLSSGLAIPIAISFGAKEYDKLKQYIGNIVWICLFFSVLLTLGSTILSRPVLEWTRTPSDIIDMAHEYLFIILLGIPAMIAFNTLAAVLRSLGDSRTPLIILIFSSLLSIVLALAFILGLNMGVAGAAWATVLAQAFSVIGCLLYVKKHFHILYLKKSDFKLNFYHIKDLLGMGIPMGMMFFIMGIGSVFLQTAINSLGSIAVAAVTAAIRFEGLFSTLTNSIGNGIATFCGQNIGAGRVDRIKKAMKTFVAIGLGYSLIAFFIVLLFGRTMTLLFIDAESLELIELVYQYLLIISAFFWALALVHIVRAALQGMGCGKIVLVGGFLEGVARGAAGLVFVPAFGFVAACFAAPGAWVLANVFTVPAYFIIIRRASGKMQNIVD